MNTDAKHTVWIRSHYTLMRNLGPRVSSVLP